MPRKGNKVSRGAKKFWSAISTGWFIEYPNSGEAPKDFFDRSDRIPQGVREDQKSAHESERCSENEEDTSDAIFRWREQLKAAGRC
jgi:hypothetical protein